MSHYHESLEKLNEQALNISRALNSLKEEIEAIDWYNQRVVASEDAELKEIMAHNRDEEIEHAVMAIEWLRRNMDGWDHELRTYLFKEGPIAHHGEEGHEGETELRGLNIGDLK